MYKVKSISIVTFNNDQISWERELPHQIVFNATVLPARWPDEVLADLVASMNDIEAITIVMNDGYRFFLAPLETGGYQIVSTFEVETFPSGVLSKDFRIMIFEDYFAKARDLHPVLAW